MRWTKQNCAEFWGPSGICRCSAGLAFACMRGAVFDVKSQVCEIVMEEGEEEAGGIMLYVCVLKQVYDVPLPLPLLALKIAAA